jgi:hypothetical protein
MELIKLYIQMASMSGISTANYTIRYVLKKSFDIDTSTVFGTQPESQVISLLITY